MGTILLIILGIGAVFAVGAVILSEKADPKDRAKEAASAAAAGTLFSVGCLIQCVLAALPVIIGLAIIGAVMRSCR